MGARPPPLPRGYFSAFAPTTPRWHDNDACGHVNNVVYHAFFDTVVNRLLAEAGASAVLGPIVEAPCTFFANIALPDEIEVGARGAFTDVYVDRATQKSADMPEAVRAALSQLAGEQAGEQTPTQRR